MQKEDISRRIKDLQATKESYIHIQQEARLKYVEINKKEYLSIPELYWSSIYASANQVNGDGIKKLNKEIEELKKKLKKPEEQQ